MKVAHVINSLGFGGAERQLSTLVPAFSQLGMEQQVIPLMDTKSGVGIPEPALLRARGRWQLVAAMLQAARFAKNADGVLVAWMYHSWLVALVAHLLGGRRCRLFFYCRHGSPETLRASTRALASMLLRVAKALGIVVVFNSRAAMRMHQELVPGLQGVLIPNAVGSNARAKSRRSRTVAFLGRNHRDKGADRVGDVACRLLRRLPGSWEFVAAGPGMPARRAEIDAALAGGGVDPRRMLVQGGIDDVQAFMLSVDVLVLPSRTESFPNVLAEAMMVGIPVAAMDVGGVRDLLDGLVEPSSDIDGLVAQAEAMCLMGEEEYLALGSALRNSVERRYGVSGIAKQHVDLWEGTRA